MNHGFFETSGDRAERKLDALIDLVLPLVPLSALNPEVQEAIIALRNGDTEPARKIARESND